MASAIRVTVLTSDEGEQFGSDDTVVRDTPLFSPDNGSTYVSISGFCTVMVLFVLDNLVSYQHSWVDYA